LVEQESNKCSGDLLGTGINEDETTDKAQADLDNLQKRMLFVVDGEDILHQALLFSLRVPR